MRTKDEQKLPLESVGGSSCNEPDNCAKEYKEDVCEECEFKNFNMVGHPGGSSYHSTEEYYCELGHWKDDF